MVTILGRNACSAVSEELVDWKAVFEFVSVCGKSHNPRSFAMDIVKNVGSLIDFDQSIVYFLDAKGNAEGQYQKNVAEKWSNAYLEYYININGDRDIFGDVRENVNQIRMDYFDWSNPGDIPRSFISNFIRPRGITYSIDLAFPDLNGKFRIVISFDKTSRKDFTNKEISNLYYAAMLLTSIHKNFYYSSDILSSINQAQWVEWHLTAREIEVLDLLSQGLSSQEISNTLYISTATVYKHIQHIYEKLHIRSQKELMALLLKR